MAKSSQLPRKSSLISHGNEITSKICSAPNHNHYSFEFFLGLRKYEIKNNGHFLWLRALIEGWRVPNSIYIQLILRLKAFQHYNLISPLQRSSIWYAQTLAVWNFRVAILIYFLRRCLESFFFHNFRISGGQHGGFNFQAESETFLFPANLRREPSFSIIT